MSQVAAGSPIANRLMSVALFGETYRKATFSRINCGPAPKQADAEGKARGQSSPDYPFVEIRDLSKTAGERVTVDLFHTVNMKPVMGDRKLAGKMGHLNSSSAEIQINQYRGGVESGGRMSQQRTLHNLRSISKANLAGWNARLKDQLTLVHVAGARGMQDDREWVVPLATDPEFADIMVNPVLPPTRNRRFFASNATSVANLDTNDILSLSDIERLRAIIDYMPFPMQPVKLDGDPQADEEPLYVLYVDSLVWHQIRVASGDRNWSTFLQNAFNRAKDFKSHPLFTGSPGMWSGILIKKMRRSIRWNAGQTVVEYDSSDVAQNVTAAVSTSRSFLLGAQALNIAYGAHGGDKQSGYHVNWHEEVTDHGNIREISTSFMGGAAKNRFVGSDGAITDWGVMTIDSYAPVIT